MHTCEMSKEMNQISLHSLIVNFSMQKFDVRKDSLYGKLIFWFQEWDFVCKLCIC